MRIEQLVKTSNNPDTYLQCHVKPGRPVELFQVKKFEDSDRGKWFTGAVYDYTEKSFEDGRRRVTFVYKRNIYFFEGSIGSDRARLTMFVQGRWSLGGDSPINVYNYDNQDRLKEVYSGTVKSNLKSGHLNRKTTFIYDSKFRELFKLKVENKLDIPVDSVTDNLYYLSQM